MKIPVSTPQEYPEIACSDTEKPLRFYAVPIFVPDLDGSDTVKMAASWEIDRAGALGIISEWKAYLSALEDLIAPRE